MPFFKPFAPVSSVPVAVFMLLVPAYNLSAPLFADFTPASKALLNTVYCVAISLVPLLNCNVYFDKSFAPSLIFFEPVFNLVVPSFNCLAPSTKSFAPSCNSSICFWTSDKSNVSFKFMSPMSELATVNVIFIEKSLTSAVTVTSSGISASLI